MKISLFFCFLTTLFYSSQLSAEPLPSWNDGPAKQSILEFVKVTCELNSPHYVKPENRIATFDQDGTLWVEHPLYTQAIFALERIQKLAVNYPEWKLEDPFRAVIENNLETIAKFTEGDWTRILAATLTGMSTEDFLHTANEWLSHAKHPRFNKKYTELIYQPMLEVIHFLRDHEFKVFIVTGGGQEFVRAYSQQVYKIPTEHIVGSSVVTKYEYNSNGEPLLMRLPKVFFINNFDGKAIGINLFIGKKPLAAFGNSDGDREMLEWTQVNDKPRLMMLVHHDDPLREYAYGPAGGLPNTQIGTFSENFMIEAKKRGWVVISMKNDWKKIFPFNE